MYNPERSQRWHPCGQEIHMREKMVGYAPSFVYLVNGQAVSHCPRCGERIRHHELLHVVAAFCQECGAATEGLPVCAGCISFLDSEYLDHQDTLASIRAGW